MKITTRDGKNRRTPYFWLGAGSVALGLGIALVTDAMAVDVENPVRQAISTPTRTLYDHLRTATDTKQNPSVQNGIAIDKHIIPDGQKQMTVYLGGTTFDPDNQFILRNVPALAGELDAKQIDTITAALDGDTTWKIMLVGFSQGGMDAQNIAAKANFKEQITTVVTYASPIVQKPGSYDYVHIWDHGDPAPHLTLLLYPSEYDSVREHVFEAASANDSALVYNANLAWFSPGSIGLHALIWAAEKLTLHGAHSTYEQVSEAFDNAAGFDAVKADIHAYLNRQHVG